MAAALIDGRAFAEKLRARVAAAVPDFVERAGRQPGLATVLVGEDPASEVYVRAKGKATLAAGMASFERRLPADPAGGAGPARRQSEPRRERRRHPRPAAFAAAHGSRAAVIDAIDPAKDVDGFNVENAGRLAVGEEGLVPARRSAA